MYLCKCNMRKNNFHKVKSPVFLSLTSASVSIWDLVNPIIYPMVQEEGIVGKHW